MTENTPNNPVDLEELKKKNPEEYFKEILCTDDSEELKRLNTESN